MQRKQIIERDNNIIFGEFSWPKTVKTNYLIYGKGKDGVAKEYYTLECLLYLLKNIALQHPVYVRQAASEDVQALTTLLKDYKRNLDMTSPLHRK